jgi:hypothetical protein
MTLRMTLDADERLGTPEHLVVATAVQLRRR